jgi:phenylacetaldehyde dehydrogenase
MNEMTSISAQPAYSEGVKALLGRKPALFSRRRLGRFEPLLPLCPSTTPRRGREIARIVDASDADCDRAVAAARAAFDDGRWSGPPAGQARAGDHAARRLIEANLQELAELESIDNGKPKIASAGYDLPKCVETLRYCAGWATRISGEHIEPSSFPAGSIHAYVRREPVGVCVQIVPWNFPLMMAVQKIAPALAAGCTLVLKPAEQTPLTALRLADLVAEAGIPAGVFNLVTGMGETAGDRLVRHATSTRSPSPARPRSARSSTVPRPTR